MTKKRTALISAGVAAGALAAGAVGSVVVRRRNAQVDEGTLWDLPPEDLGDVTSFDGTRIAVRAAGPPEAPVMLFVHGFSLDATTWYEQWVDLSRGLPLRRDGSPRARDDRVAPRTATSPCARWAATWPRCSISSPPSAPPCWWAIRWARWRSWRWPSSGPSSSGTRVAGVVLIGAASSDLLQGAMGSVTGAAAAPARHPSRRRPSASTALRKAVLASPATCAARWRASPSSGPTPPSPWWTTWCGLAQSASSEVWTDGLARLMEMDLRHAVPRVTVPALVVVGEHDRVTPPASAVGLAGALPDARLVVLEGAGHMAMLERPERARPRDPAFAPTVLGPDAPPSAAPQAEGREGGGLSVARTLAEVGGRGGGLHALPAVRRAAPRWSSASATRTPTCCSSGRRPASTRTSRASPFVGAAGQLLTRMLGRDRARGATRCTSRIS